MLRTQLALSSSAEVIEDVIKTAPTEGIDYSDPVIVESVADALDASIGGGEVRQIPEMVVLVAHSDAAMTSFVDRLLGVLKKHGGEQVTVQDPASGEPLGVISDEIGRDGVHKVLSA
jgi:hypothetical protein